jgi:uncharacterized protein YrrD
MKIRFALPVRTTDGPLGEVGDVVIDPITRCITHIVVEPHHRHHQARLVSIDDVTVDEQGVALALGSAQFRALPSVADSDFVRVGEEIDLGDGWDVGIEHVVAMPYTGASFAGGGWADMSAAGGGVTVDFDRIPKGECEIRRNSHVVTSDGHTAGIVDGFIADDTHIEGVIVQTGLPGFRHLVVVPIGSVSNVSNDHVAIALSKDVFHRLQPVEGLDGYNALNSRLERWEHSSASTVKRLRIRTADLLHRRSNTAPHS